MAQAGPSALLSERTASESELPRRSALSCSTRASRIDKDGIADKACLIQHLYVTWKYLSGAHPLISLQSRVLPDRL